MWEPAVEAVGTGLAGLSIATGGVIALARYVCGVRLDLELTCNAMAVNTTILLAAKIKLKSSSYRRLLLAPEKASDHDSTSGFTVAREVLAVPGSERLSYGESVPKIAVFEGEKVEPGETVTDAAEMLFRRRPPADDLLGYEVRVAVSIQVPSLRVWHREPRIYQDRLFVPRPPL